MTLEALIAEAARTGRFNLTIFQTASGFQASFGRDISTWHVEHAADPATAIAKVLGAAPIEPAPEVDLFS